MEAPPKSLKIKNSGGAYASSIGCAESPEYVEGNQRLSGLTPIYRSNEPILMFEQDGVDSPLLEKPKGRPRQEEVTS